MIQSADDTKINSVDLQTFGFCHRTKFALQKAVFTLAYYYLASPLAIFTPFDIHPKNANFGYFSEIDTTTIIAIPRSPADVKLLVDLPNHYPHPSCLIFHAPSPGILL